MDDPELDLTGELVRAYVITSGHSLPTDNTYTMTSLVVASPGAAEARHVVPEARQILRLVSGGHLSVVEVAGHTRLPLGVVRILLAQLEESGLIRARPPVPRAESPDRDLLNAVLIGLKARLGSESCT